jgi:ketosteroid isomerase-like protein
MTTTSEELRTFGERWTAAEVAADVPALAAMATDDFRLVGPFGFVLDKQAWLDRYASGDLVTRRLSWHDVEVREVGGVAVAIGTYTQQAAHRGTPNDGDFRSTHVFVRDGGGWRMASAHLSLGSPPGPPPSRPT